MNNRRGFLKFLGGAAATATLDPERLLWVPGQRVISIPAPRVITMEEFHARYIDPYFEALVKAFNFEGNYDPRGMDLVLGFGGPYRYA